MPVEVEVQDYLFIPEDTDLPDKKPGFRMNILHDIESVWWAFAWTFFYYMDKDCHPVDLAAQQRKFQAAFPGTVYRATRQNFFISRLSLNAACNTLSRMCKLVCSELPTFAATLRKSYRKAEESYPMINIDDILLEDVHGKASSYIEDSLVKAGDIRLCPVHTLLGNKRPKEEHEASPTPSPKTKRPHHG